MQKGVSDMTHEEENQEACLIWGLPDDVLYIILSYCDLQTVSRVSQVCRRFARLVDQDCVWVSLSKKLVILRDNKRYNKNGISRHGLKEQCRVARNLQNGKFRDIRVVNHKAKQLPWIQMEKSHLWISYKDKIRCYQQKKSGHLKEFPAQTLRGNEADITRFAYRDGHIVSGARDGRLACYNVYSGSELWSREQCHTCDIHDVDFYQNTVLSGSRDATAKIWSMSASEEESLMHTVMVEDRIWSVALNPNGCTFVLGTAGIKQLQPLYMYDTETARLLGAMGLNYRKGAGVLDVQYESPHIVLSCGYDTLVRMWDTRASLTHCVGKWEEPFDSTIYSVKSDGHNSILAGTARYGMTRLWDKRHTKHVQVYFCGTMSSPVYSMAFDTSHLYLALDKGIHMLDFSKR